MFLYYILNEDKNYLISMVFGAQVRKPVKNDWAVIVRKDLDDLEITENLKKIHLSLELEWSTK